MPEETNLELDQPSPSDLVYEELFGSTGGELGNVLMMPAHIQNQGAKPATRMACSRFGICHAINAQNKAVSERDGMRYFELPAELYW